LEDNGPATDCLMAAIWDASRDILVGPEETKQFLGSSEELRAVGIYGKRSYKGCGVLDRSKHGGSSGGGMVGMVGMVAGWTNASYLKN